MEHPALQGTVLVVDDDEGILAVWTRALRDTGARVITERDPLNAGEILGHTTVDVVVSDLQMPGKDGMTLLREIKASRPEVEVVMMTGFGTIKTAVEAIKLGAYDFLTKPFEGGNETLVRTATRALDRKRLADRNRQLEAQVDFKTEYEGMVGHGAAMKRVFETVETVAGSLSSVLLVGESGTGKELVARALHYRSPRRDAPFVPVNCAAITETLLESELFGHVKGAFTGATATRRGLFETADHGTIFLDEIGEVPPAVQVRLLRVVQEGEVRPVGASTNIAVDVRVVAATNRDLAAAVRTGGFREDLYYRLNVINIALPPLRERTEDVPLLAHHFLRKYAGRAGKKVAGIDDPALDALCAHRWPGNVRELENVIERAVVLCRGENVAITDLPPEIAAASAVGSPRTEWVTDTGGAAPIYKDAKARAVRDFERRYFSDLLARTDGSIAEAARLAGLDRSNFAKLLARHPDIREGAGKKGR